MSDATATTPIEADDRETGLRGARLPAHFRRIPDALNALVIAAQVAGFAAFVAAATLAQNPWWMVPLCAGFALWMVGVFSTIHEAEHGILFTGRRINDGAGIVVAALFPGPFHLLRQGHVGHHLRNRSDDEAFEFWFPGESPAWKWAQWLGILTGGFYLMVVLGNVVVLFLPFLVNRKVFAFDRPSAAFVESLNPKYARIIAAEAAGVIALHVAIVWLGGVPVWRYVALYASFGALWSALQYVHHYGTERHVTRGARNLWLFPVIDRLWLNHNWHRTHHEHPTVSWVHLDKLGRSTATERRGWLPLAYLRMWRGPRAATERVANRFAGRVVR